MEIGTYSRQQTIITVKYIFLNLIETNIIVVYTFEENLNLVFIDTCNDHLKQTSLPITPPPDQILTQRIDY